MIEKAWQITVFGLWLQPNWPLPEKTKLGHYFCSNGQKFFWPKLMQGGRDIISFNDHIASTEIQSHRVTESHSHNISTVFQLYCYFTLFKTEIFKSSFLLHN